MVHFFLFPNKCPFSSIYPWVSNFSFGHFWRDKLVHSLKEDHLKLYSQIVNTDVSKILRHKTVHRRPHVIFKTLHISPLIPENLTRWLEDPFCSYSTNTISWSARPIWGIPLTLVTGVGLFVSRMSRVFKDNLREAMLLNNIYQMGLHLSLDIPRGTFSLFQSISPQLKVPTYGDMGIFVCHDPF